MDGPPPGNGEGPRGSGPTPEELTRRGEDKSAFCVAQPYAHPVTRTERFPGGLPHYSHEVCVACGRHLRWHPKSRNDERRKLLAAYVARLAMCRAPNKLGDKASSLACRSSGTFRRSRKRSSAGSIVNAGGATHERRKANQRIVAGACCGACSISFSERQA